MLKTVEYHPHFKPDCNPDYEVAEIPPTPVLL